MKWPSMALGLVGLVSCVSAQADTTAYTDTETGIVFQSYTTDDGVSLRVALPANATGEYDALLQIEAPSTFGWIGWAWGGTMAYNPLTVVWANGNSVVHSTREAYGFYSPSVYNGTQYKVLKGTEVAGGKVKFTAVCTGCTTWTDSTGSPQTLDLTQPARLAFGFSKTAVNTPADSTSGFQIHDTVGHWYADLAGSQSPKFDAWVAQNTPSSNSTFKIRGPRA